MESSVDSEKGNAYDSNDDEHTRVEQAIIIIHGARRRAVRAARK